jgi:hypothetical protein
LKGEHAFIHSAKSPAGSSTQAEIERVMTDPKPSLRALLYERATPIFAVISITIEFGVTAAQP